MGEVLAWIWTVRPRVCHLLFLYADMHPLRLDHLYAQAQRAIVIGKIDVGGDDVCQVGKVWNGAIFARARKGGAFFV